MKIPHRAASSGQHGCRTPVSAPGQQAAGRFFVGIPFSTSLTHTFLTRLAQPFTGSPAHTQSKSVLVIFVLEIVVKFIAEGRSPWLFFTDNWNVFDFLIVAIGFMPIGGGGSVTVLRLLRLLRVLKLVKALPKLRILVIGLIKSFSSIAYIGVLLVLQFFLFAVLAVSVFGENDPVHLGNLHIAFLTLFRQATFEDWTDVMTLESTAAKTTDTVVWKTSVLRAPRAKGLVRLLQSIGLSSSWWPQ